MIDFEKRAKEIVAWLQQEYTGIRTGQAAPALLDSVRVENYGTKTPINQVATVGVEDARTLRVSPWDAGNISAIETGIREADLGVSVASDSSGLRVAFPELTSERREQLLKLAGQKLEDARISVRGARDEAMKEIDKQKQDSELSKDEHFSAKEQIQKQVEAANKKLDDVYAAKEAEIAK